MGGQTAKTNLYMKPKIARCSQHFNSKAIVYNKKQDNSFTNKIKVFFKFKPKADGSGNRQTASTSVFVGICH